MFCCFKSQAVDGHSTAAGSARPKPGDGAAPAGSTVPSGTALSQEEAVKQQNASEAYAEGQRQQFGHRQQNVSLPAAQDGVMRVVALLQELLGHTSERMQVRW